MSKIIFAVTRNDWNEVTEEDVIPKELLTEDVVEIIKAQYVLKRVKLTPDDIGKEDKSIESIDVPWVDEYLDDYENGLDEIVVCGKLETGLSMLTIVWGAHRWAERHNNGTEVYYQITGKYCKEELASKKRRDNDDSRTL